MNNNRIKVYWILLLVLMYTASISLSVGQTHARYENTVVADTVVEAAPVGMQSNCMVKKGDPALTVLVGELPLRQPTTVSFWMKSCGENRKGKFSWGVSNSKYAEYLNLSMKIGPETIGMNDEIELMEDIPMDFTLVINPSSIARDTEHAQMKINVVVTWGSEMWGTFQVILPEVKNQNAESGNDDPENVSSNNNGQPLAFQSNGERTNTAQSLSMDAVSNLQKMAVQTGIAEPMGAAAHFVPVKNSPQLRTLSAATPKYTVQLLSATTEPTSTDPTAETTAPPTEATEPVTEPTVPSTETTEPVTEPTVPSTEATEPTVPSTEATEPTTEPTVPPTEATQPPEEPTVPDTPVQKILLQTLSRFDPTEQLPVRITVTKEITSVRLGLQKMDGETTKFEPFPDYTMFSLNQGESYYMMYDGYITEFALDDNASLTVLLDFSHTEVQEDETLVLAMEAYTGYTLKTTCTAQTVSDARKSCMSLQHPLNAETQAVIFTAGDTRESAAEAQAFGWPSRTLSHKNALEFTLPMEWLDADLEYSVEMLTMTENQTLVYQPVTLSANGLYGKYTDFDLTHNLVFRVGKNLPQAGTYRLNMKWSYEGICFAKTQTTFFINYAA